MLNMMSMSCPRVPERCLRWLVIILMLYQYYSVVTQHRPGDGISITEHTVASVLQSPSILCHENLSLNPLFIARNICQ
jgi:hypothetical protein